MKTHNLSTQDCTWAYSQGGDVPGTAVQVLPNTELETVLPDGQTIKSQYIIFVPFSNSAIAPKGKDWEKFEVEEGPLKGYVGYFRILGDTDEEPELH